MGRVPANVPWRASPFSVEPPMNALTLRNPGPLPSLEPRRLIILPRGRIFVRSGGEEGDAHVELLLCGSGLGRHGYEFGIGDFALVVEAEDDVLAPASLISSMASWLKVSQKSWPLKKGSISSNRTVTLPSSFPPESSSKQVRLAWHLVRSRISCTMK